MPTVKVYNGDSFFDLATDLSVFYISNDTYIQENINHYFYYYTNVNDASSFTAAIRNHKANVSYFYNYGDSPNDGYYRIDNYGYGETIKYVPQNPLRNGYVFFTDGTKNRNVLICRISRSTGFPKHNTTKKVRKLIRKRNFTPSGLKIKARFIEKRYSGELSCFGALRTSFFSY